MDGVNGIRRFVAGMMPAGVALAAAFLLTAASAPALPTASSPTALTPATSAPSATSPTITIENVPPSDTAGRIETDLFGALTGVLAAGIGWAAAGQVEARRRKAATEDRDKDQGWDVVIAGADYARALWDELNADPDERTPAAIAVRRAAADLKRLSNLVPRTAGAVDGLLRIRTTLKGSIMERAQQLNDTLPELLDTLEAVCLTPPV